MINILLSSDGGEILIAVASIIWCILCIILFFKVWGMCNDVRVLKKDHFCETQFDTKEDMASYLRKNLVLGNMENVKRILLQNFIDNVEYGFTELKKYGCVKDENGNDRWVNLEEQNLKVSIAPYVKNLMMQYAKIGEEVPAYIVRMETFGDYYRLFVKEELAVEIEKKTEKNK